MAASMPATKRVGEDWISPLPEHASASPSVPPLPPVKTINPDLYVGPTEESNWVIYGRLLVGAYPSSVHDDANTRILSGILRLGVTTFVCLQQEYQHEGVKEYEWRAGFKLRPYIFDAIKLVDTLPASFFPTGTKPEGLEFVHFPIVDCSIANDSSVLQLAHDLVTRLVKGENMYIHCWGGHGRTGTVVSIMLGLLYGIGPLDAMRWVQFCHDLRIAPMGTPSPQTEAQRQQVIRILNAVQRQARGKTGPLLSPQPVSAADRRAGAALTATPSPKMTPGKPAGAGVSTATQRPAPPKQAPAVIPTAPKSVASPTTKKPVQLVGQVDMGTTPHPPGGGSDKASAETAEAPLGLRNAVVANPMHPPAKDSSAAATADITAAVRPASAMHRATASMSSLARTSSRPGTASGAGAHLLVAPNISVPIPANAASNHLLSRIASKSKQAELHTSEVDIGLNHISEAPGSVAANVEATLDAALGQDTTKVDTSIPTPAEPDVHTAAVPSHKSSEKLVPRPPSSDSTKASLQSRQIDVVKLDKVLEDAIQAEEEAHASLHSQSYVLLEKQKAAAAPVELPEPTMEEPNPRPLTHISPRPASVMSLTEAPRLEKVLADPMATAVAPLVSSAASVLGLEELVASKSHIHHHVAPIRGQSSIPEGSETPASGGSTSRSLPQAAPEGESHIPTVHVSLATDFDASSAQSPVLLQPRAPAPKPTTLPLGSSATEWPSSLGSGNSHSGPAHVKGSQSAEPSTASNPLKTSTGRYADASTAVREGAAVQASANRSGSVPARARLLPAAASSRLGAEETSRPGSATRLAGPTIPGRTGKLPSMPDSSRSGSVPKSLPSRKGAEEVARPRPVPVHTTSPPSASAHGAPSKTLFASPTSRTGANRARIQVHNRQLTGATVPSPSNVSPSAPSRPSPAYAMMPQPQPPAGAPSPRQLTRFGPASPTMRMPAAHATPPERAVSPTRAARGSGLRTVGPSASTAVTRGAQAVVESSPRSGVPPASSVVFTERDIMGLVKAALPGTPASRPGTSPTSAMKPAPSLRELLASLLPPDTRGIATARS